MRYEIKGGDMPVAEIILNQNESIKCQAGAMAWMDPNIQMKTKGESVGRMLGRKLTGENAFLNQYTAKNGPGMITIGSSFPGSILAVEIEPGKEIICQKTAYLASTEGIALSPYLQKKIGTALFGGEGFLMQKISGYGLVFLEIDGTGMELTLAPGEKLVISTGHLAMMDATCSLDIETVQGGIKSFAFGGEGFFNTIVTGPGRVTVQTLPKESMARNLMGLFPVKRQ